MSARFNRRSNNLSNSSNPGGNTRITSKNSGKSRNSYDRNLRNSSEQLSYNDSRGNKNSSSSGQSRENFKRVSSRSSEYDKRGYSSNSRFESRSGLIRQGNESRLSVRGRNDSSNRFQESQKSKYNQNVRDPRFNSASRNENLGSYSPHNILSEPEDQENDLVWGRHSTQAVFDSGRPIHRIWCTPEIRNSPKFLQVLKEAKRSGVLLEEVTWARLGQLTSGGVHQGIALQTAASKTLDLKTLIKGCENLGESALLVALDGLTDPQNLGAIVRSAEALGAHGMVLPQRRSAGLTGSVAKVAAGALEHLPVARVVNLNRSLEVLKKEGYTVIGLADEGDLTISEINLDGPLVVVTGSEGKGISLVTRRHCDQLVRIPMRGVTTSLNASVATALLLYEVARRGWMKGITGQAPSPKLVRAKYASISQINTE